MEVSYDSLNELSSILPEIGKKLEIFLRQLKRLDNLEKENDSSMKMGLLSKKDFEKNMKRVEKEKKKLENGIRDLLESLIKEILKST
jgi:tetrahydromethanopterin S-methyltransferase subunit G